MNRNSHYYKNNHIHKTAFINNMESHCITDPMLNAEINNQWNEEYNTMIRKIRHEINLLYFVRNSPYFNWGIIDIFPTNRRSSLDTLVIWIELSRKEMTLDFFLENQRLSWKR